MTLKEALDKVSSAIATNGSYVFLDKYANCEQQWAYVIDMETIHLSYDQLDKNVLFSNLKIWTPMSNFMLGVTIGEGLGTYETV